VREERILELAERVQGLRAGSVEDAALVGDRDGGGPVADAELVVKMQQVGLDRGLADQQLAGGRLVGGAGGRLARTPTPVTG
jgi:hypothetical protein